MSEPPSLVIPLLDHSSYPPSPGSDSHNRAESNREPIEELGAPASLPGLTSHRVWKPRILRLPITLSTIILLLAIIGALEAFIRISRSQSGFAPPSHGNLLALTYAPILGFVCMGLVWKSWELEVKKLMPWADMLTGPVRAEDSIVLDYIGANYFEVLWIAAKHKHWPVLLAILGSGMLAVCNIAATSPWTVISTPIIQPTQLLKTTAFDRTFDADATGYLADYFGHLLYGVPTPDWTYNNHVLTSFEMPADDDTPSLLSGITEAYAASLSCEWTHMAPDPDGYFMTSIGGTQVIPALSVTASWRECSQTFNITGFDTGFSSLLGRVDDMTCGFSRAAIISTFRFSNASLVGMAAIACQPQFTRSEFSVVINSSTSRIEGVPTISSSDPVTLPEGQGLLYWLHRTNHLYREFSQDENDFSTPWPWPHAVLFNSTVPYDTVSLQVGTWINLLGRVRNITDSDVLDYDRLGKLSADVFQEIFPYVALRAYGHPSSDISNGTRTVYASRIFAKEPSIRVLQASLSVLIVITIALYLARPNAHLTMDPGSILALATVLSVSQRLGARLAATGRMPKQELAMHLDDMSYSTSLDDHGVLMVKAADRKESVSDSLSTASEPIASLGALPMWRPFMLALPLRVSIVVIIAVCIAALELIHRRSVRDGGLVDLVGQGKVEHYSWTYLAPAILFIVGLALASVDSAIRVTEPFRLMASGPQPARILAFNPNFAGVFSVFPNSLMHREYLTAIIGLTALLLPIAKIVLAGLLVTGETEASASLPLRLDTQFNQSFNSSLDFGLWSFLRDPAYNISRPLLTTNTYAVAGTEPLPSSNGTSTVDMRLPVGYAVLGDCRRVSASDFTFSSTAPGTWDFKWSIDYPSCPFAEYRLVQEGDTSLNALALVWDPRGGPDGQSCGEQIHFIVGPRTSNFTYLACDWNLIQSTMLVTMAGGDSENPRIISVDPTSELDRKVIPVRSNEHGDLWTGFNATAMLPNCTSDPFFTGLFASQRSVDISAYFDPDYLENILRRDWSSFWALQFDLKMRVPSYSTVAATSRYRVARLTVATTPARILQGLLGTILVIVLGVFARTPMQSVLPKPPYSIAAQMSLIAGSRLLRRIEGGGSLDGLLVRLSWWDDESGKRYGIDIEQDCEERVPLSPVERSV